MRKHFINILALLAAMIAVMWLTAVATASGVARHTSENAQNDSWCASMGGKREVRYYYTTDSGDRGYVSVDCETATHSWEGGLDKRSSQDSVHQTTFYSLMSGKLPGVVIYDTDGVEGKDEMQIREVCELLGIEYRNPPAVW